MVTFSESKVTTPAYFYLLFLLTITDQVVSFDGMGSF